MKKKYKIMDFEFASILANNRLWLGPITNLQTLDDGKRF